MLVLRYNKLPAKDLFEIEQVGDRVQKWFIFHGAHGVLVVDDQDR